MDWSEHYPNSEIGKRFCQFFQARFNFIEAEVFTTKPQPHEKNPHNKPSWKTVSEYPIQHINLWRRFNSEQLLIGLSFDKTTNYFLIDIDIKSPYHPLNDESAFRKLLGAYEDIGFNDYLLVQSSESEGIHVYFPLPKELPTYELAETVKLIAIKEGLKVKDGWLEFFPNAKHYNPDKPTAYKAHRLPLQPNTGSYLLDDNYQPYSEDIAVFLEQAEQIAASQDIDLIETAILAAKKIKQFRHIKGDGGKASRFASDLKEQMEEGRTDFGQTNELLRIIGTYGRVFERLEGKELADYIAETAKTSSGYKQYCRHQHNIYQRAKDWAKCIEKFYYPYGSKPTRVGRFIEMVKKAIKGENKTNKKRQNDAIERIKAAMEHIKSTYSELPEQVMDMKELMLQTIKELFNIRASDKTLVKHKNLWHPKYKAEHSPELLEQEVQEETQPEPKPEEDLNDSPTTNDEIPQNESEPKTPEPSPCKEPKKFAPPECYMKVREWAEKKIQLIYRGNPVSDQILIQDKHLEKSQKTINPAQEVVISNYNHSSFLFHSDPENLFVYVQPVDAKNWLSGILVKLIYLKPT